MSEICSNFVPKLREYARTCTLCAYSKEYVERKECVTKLIFMVRRNGKIGVYY